MEPVRARHWNIRHSDADMVRQLARTCGLSPLIAGLLVNRGIREPEVAARYLSSTLADIRDPFLLLGMEQAVTRLAAAAEKGERVCVYGDYDVDGITSVALLISFLRTSGIDCFYYVPKRMEEGYGLSEEGLRDVAGRGARVVVSVDCGITAVAEARFATALGIDLIITDHHTPGDELPAALAVINPHQRGCSYPFKALAGVGVAFNLLIALRSRLRENNFFAGRVEPNLRQFLDLVALGTIADIVPLIDENRVFVKYGLLELTDSSRPGVQALKRVAGVVGEVGCGAVGFRLAPRLNAAGRLEDAALGVELLLTDDPGRAAALAEELDASNRERQTLEQEILRDALARVQGVPAMRGRKSIVLASEAWHPGVIGIVASRIVDLFHRPTILIALKDGSGRGSGRSIPNFHLYDAINACSEHLLKFGGHRQAAGLSIDEATLEAFVDSFDKVACGLLGADDLTPRLSVDRELAAGELSADIVEQVSRLEPFGMGNPEPLFMMRNVAVGDRRVLKGGHLKLRLLVEKKSFDAIGFNMAEQQIGAGRVDVAFSPQINEWNGRKSLQLRLKDLRAAEG